MTDSTPTTFAGLVNGILGLISYIVPLIFAFLFLYFAWKMVDAWVINAGDEKKREEGKQFLVVTVVVFVLMLSTWGIVSLLKDSLF